MAILVKRLVGEEIPYEHRSDGVDVLFRVTSAEGIEHYYPSELDAAKVAAEMSEAEKRDA